MFAYFENPIYLLGLPIIALGFYFLRKYSSKAKAHKAILISNFNLIEEASQNRKDWFLYLLPSLQIVSLCAFCLALSEPTFWVDRLTKSGQIILAIDISRSMEATDLSPSRIIAARQAALSFVENLPPALEIGIELFHKNAILALAPTKNRQIVQKTLQEINLNTLGNGTALGEAILLASKTINKNQNNTNKADLILLSDGESNTGIDPMTAISEIQNLTIYTIGIGSIVGAVVQEGLITKMHPDTLQDIAYTTGGSYHEVWQGNKQLQKIYKSLSANYTMQKVQIKTWPYFLICGLFAASLAYILDWTKFRNL